jgi:hypothetical protein
MTDEITFTVERSEPGYNHVCLHGTYTGPATVEDVKKRFYHEYFGGREAWCRDGRFGCVYHID